MRASVQKGFTLLEMLVVLSIIAVLASMAIPRYKSIVVQREIDATANELMLHVERARVYAQNYGYKVKLCPVSQQQINQPLPMCNEHLSATDPWEAWVILRLDKQDKPDQVLSRSSIISANVSVFGNANTGSGRIINSLGQSDFAGFTVSVQAHAVIANTTPAQVVLAHSGRVRLQ
ncbi:MAG: pilus assembly FimT family protein [Formosimonas sp.]